MSKSMGSMSGAGELLKKNLQQKMAENMAKPRQRFDDIVSGKNFEAIQNQMNMNIDAVKPSNISNTLSNNLQNKRDQLSEFATRLNPKNFRETGDKMFYEMINRDKSGKKNIMEDMIKNLDQTKFNNAQNQIANSLRNNPIDYTKQAINNPVKDSILSSVDQFNVNPDDIKFPSFDDMSAQARAERKKRVEEFLRNY
mgnify:CR=1 FL=1